MGGGLAENGHGKPVINLMRPHLIIINRKCGARRRPEIWSSPANTPHSRGTGAAAGSAYRVRAA